MLGFTSVRDLGAYRWSKGGPSLLCRNGYPVFGFGMRVLNLYKKMPYWFQEEKIGKHDDIWHLLNTIRQYIWNLAILVCLSGLSGHWLKTEQGKRDGLDLNMIMSRAWLEIAEFEPLGITLRLSGLTTLALMHGCRTAGVEVMIWFHNECHAFGAWEKVWYISFVALVCVGQFGLRTSESRN